MSLPDWISRKRVWIFDLDDTLFPEIDFVFSGYRAVSEKVFEDFSVDIEPILRARFLRGERGDLFTPSLAEKGVDPGEPYVKTLVDTYRTHAPQLSMYVDATALLTALAQANCRLGVVTDGWEQVQARKVKALNLASQVDAVVLTDAIGGRPTWKPDPAGYRTCLDELDAAPDDAVFVGDNPMKDFVGARRVGIASVRVRRPVTECFNAAPAPGNEADTEVSSLAEVLRRLHSSMDQ